MLDHVVEMFSITREKILVMMDAQQASIVRERAKLQSAELEGDDNIVLSSDRENIKEALALLDEREDHLAVEREHLDTGPEWKISAAQLRELYTRYATIELPPVSRLKLVIDAGKQIRAAMHNMSFRQART